MNLFKSSQPTSLIQSVALVPDRPNLTYNSGELVTGHCIISVNGSLDISQVELKLSGKAKVAIPVTRNQSQSNIHNHSHQQQQQQQHQQNVTTIVRKECSILKLVYNPATGESSN